MTDFERSANYNIALILICLFNCMNSCMNNNNNSNVNESSWEKFDSNLKDKINSKNFNVNEEMKVLVFFSPEKWDGIEGVKTSEWQSTFTEEASEVVSKLENMGVDNIDILWINRTLNIKVPLRIIEMVAEHDQVKKIQLALTSNAIPEN